MVESYITDTQLVEGLMAILSYIIVWHVFWNKIPRERSYSKSGLRWICVWIGRKYGTSLYVSLKEKYNINNYKFSLLPKLNINIY